MCGRGEMMACGDSGAVVSETTVDTVKMTDGGSVGVSETKTTTIEELKTVEGIITSCMETTTTSDTLSAAVEGIHST